jgi:hypothetical protein
VKLRIKGNSIRLRLTRPEVTSLGRGETVEEATHFPDGAVMRCRLEVAADVAMLSAHFASGALVVRIASRAAIEWSSGLNVGIDCAITLPGGGTLQVLVEKDFECLHSSHGERTEGTFPHPARPASPGS